MFFQSWFKRDSKVAGLYIGMYTIGSYNRAKESRLLCIYALVSAYKLEDNCVFFLQLFAFEACIDHMFPR